MKNKKTTEDLVNEFLIHWDCKQQVEFLRDIIPLFELYDVDDEEDWLKKEVDEGTEKDIRLIRTVYLVSRICEFHAGKMLSINMRFKDLWKRMQKEGLEMP